MKPCGNCGKDRTAHRLANFADGPKVGAAFLVCPTAVWSDDPMQPGPCDKPTPFLRQPNTCSLCGYAMDIHGTGRAASPIPTVTARDHHSLVTSNLVKLYGTSTGAELRDPAPTVTAGGWHLGEVRAFLTRYNGQDGTPELGAPLGTVTTRDRFALLTVAGVEYAIADIGMRMLAARELFRAQGFPDSYKIDGLGLTKTQQIEKAGNSVCPPVAAAIVAANFQEQRAARKRAA